MGELRCDLRALGGAEFRAAFVGGGYGLIDLLFGVFYR